MKNKMIQVMSKNDKNDGKYAVSNKKGTYLTNYVYDSELEAIEQSMIMNVSDLHIKMEAEYEKLVKCSPSKYAPIAEYGEGRSTLGDILA